MFWIMIDNLILMQEHESYFHDMISKKNTEVESLRFSTPDARSVMEILTRQGYF